MKIGDRDDAGPDQVRKIGGWGGSKMRQGSRGRPGNWCGAGATPRGDGGASGGQCPPEAEKM